MATIQDKQELIEELESLGMDEAEIEAWLIYCEDVGCEPSDYNAFQDSFNGFWDSERDFAENIFDECYAHEISNEILHIYFDYEMWTRDLFLCDYYRCEETGAVWRAC